MVAIKGSSNSSYLTILRMKKAMTNRATIIRGILDILEMWVNI
jgi:hypothetical protein